MTKQEFLDELRKALSGEVSPESMMDSYQYYADYIEEGVRRGKTEQEMTEELGSPLLIARAIIAAQTGERVADVEYTEDGRTRKARNKNAGYHGGTEKKQFQFRSDAWYAKILFWLGMFAVLTVLVFIVFGLLSSFLWIVIHFAIPLLLLLGIIYLIMYALK